MVSILTQLFGTILGFLDGILPGSPFAEWLAVTDDLLLGLSWLNWVMPMTDMIALMTAWIGVCFLVTTAKVFILDGGSIARMVMRGGE